MRASTIIKRRSARLSLLAGALALTVWGATLLATPQASSDLSRKPNLEMQVADGGGGRPNG